MWCRMNTKDSFEQIKISSDFQFKNIRKVWWTCPTSKEAKEYFTGRTCSQSGSA